MSSLRWAKCLALSNRTVYVWTCVCSEQSLSRFFMSVCPTALSSAVIALPSRQPLILFRRNSAAFSVVLPLFCNVGFCSQVRKLASNGNNGTALSHWNSTRTCWNRTVPSLFSQVVEKKVIIFKLSSQKAISGVSSIRGWSHSLLVNRWILVLWRKRLSQMHGQ